MSKEVLFDCSACGGDVIVSTGTNRKYYGYDVPDDYRISTCKECGEFYFTTEAAEKLYSLLTGEILFDCDTCGGDVVMQTEPGRTKIIKGKSYEIPQDFGMATCQDCGETYMSINESTELTLLLTKETTDD